MAKQKVLGRPSPEDIPPELLDQLLNPDVSQLPKKLRDIFSVRPGAKGWRKSAIKALGDVYLERWNAAVAKQRALGGKSRATKKRRDKQKFDDIMQARAALIDHFQLHEYATNVGICQRIAQEATVPLPGTRHAMSSLIRSYWRRLVNEGTLRQRSRAVKEKAFYSSAAWRDLRYLALQQANGQCSLCGARAADGIQLHVDHIKPRSLYPHLARDLNNLQVLCSDCNIGKSNFDETNWRQHWESI